MPAIILKQIQKTLVIRFNRPAIRSPLSIDVLKRLDFVLDNVLTDESIKAIIFTGTGDVFASGADLREIAETNAQKAKEFAIRGQKLMAKISRLQQKTIAAINGYCYGGALDLALVCDLRIAAQDATFSHPGAGLGIITGWGGTQRLPRLIGQAKALEMFFTVTPVTADEALRIGLIDIISNDIIAESLTNINAGHSSHSL